MAQFDLCFICSEHMGSFKSDLTVQTGYSENAIWQLIESFTNSALSEEVISESGVCQNCFIKFNEYDEYKTLADQVQAQIISMIESNSCDGQVTSIKDEEEASFSVVDVFENDEKCDLHLDHLIEPNEVEPEAEIIVEYNWIDQKIDVDDETHESQFKPKPSTRAKKSDEILTVIMDDNNEKRYQCETCLRSFKEKSKLKAHRDIHTTERNVVCPTCGKAFKTQACLRSHRRVHNPTFMFCDFCGKPYTQKPELARHIKVGHLNIREFYCQLCGSGFGTNGHLTAHMLTHEENSSKKNVCQICNLAFHTKAKIVRHMKSHTKERDFECGICGKKFLYSYNVTAHIRHVHYHQKRKDTEKNCEVCGKRFQKLWKYREHMEEVHNIVETEYDAQAHLSV